MYERLYSREEGLLAARRLTEERIKCDRDGEEGWT